MKMAPDLEPANFAHLRHNHQPDAESQKQIGREVAHDLNNILTIIRGYADRMLLKHGENPALRAELRMIAENTTRAISVVRQATPRRASAEVLIG
ncbi:MAG: hypothetical protein WCH99_08205 [Verrucomicrobiota bacterium]